MEIVQSITEPNKHALWLDNGKLKSYTNAGWKPINEDIVQEKLIDGKNLATIDGKSLLDGGNITVADFNVFVIKDALPETDIDENKIYIIPQTNTDGKNFYNQYKYIIKEDGSEEWKYLGKYESSVDLSALIKHQEIYSLTNDSYPILNSDCIYFGQGPYSPCTFRNTYLDGWKFYFENGSFYREKAFYCRQSASWCMEYKKGDFTLLTNSTYSSKFRLSSNGDFLFETNGNSIYQNTSLFKVNNRNDNSILLDNSNFKAIANNIYFEINSKTPNWTDFDFLQLSQGNLNYGDCFRVFHGNDTGGDSAFVFDAQDGKYLSVNWDGFVVKSPTNSLEIYLGGEPVIQSGEGVFNNADSDKVGEHATEIICEAEPEVFEDYHLVNKKYVDSKITKSITVNFTMEYFDGVYNFDTGLDEQLLSIVIRDDIYEKGSIVEGSLENNTPSLVTTIKGFCFYISDDVVKYPFEGKMYGDSVLKYCDIFIFGLGISIHAVSDSNVTNWNKVLINNNEIIV